MRTAAALAVLAAVVSLPIAGAACGGGSNAAGGAVTPSNAAPSSAPSSTDPGALGAVDAGVATTTTTTLGAGGDLQGAKLTQTTPVASTTGSAAAGSKGPHAHEPGRGPADLRAIVVAHRDEARACYDAALSAHPGIQGDLVIQWTIDPKGSVTQISEDTERSQITEPGVVACVGRVIKKIVFAPSPGGYETKAFYPFNFMPRASTQKPGTGAGTP